MRVIATKRGYYNHRRINEGEEFTLVDRKGKDKDGKAVVIPAEKQFSKLWMVKADEVDETEFRKPAKASRPAKPKVESASDEEVI